MPEARWGRVLASAEIAPMFHMLRLTHRLRPLRLVHGAARTRHRRHHRPISEPNGLPTHPQDDIILWRFDRELSQRSDHFGAC
jgi:hypothetical protein